MAAVVGTVDVSVRRHVDAVRAHEDALASGIQKIAVPVEDDHRMLAAIEHVDAILVVDAHRAVIADFLDAIELGRDPVVTGEEALASQTLVDAILQAARHEARAGR
ncbi:Gfo/Idh/MocA family oxidoreductase [Bosea sp. (in: a-proteobacteria)]|uniref:Gfo/Idh/MocA family oxidoreductase n=1 Tax=Bosea sp. (in: a-proteobacteria) TaxID=1871050 RepID=UPI00262A31C0|nr:Gfo/Idh/MocA family oxidoreductase [Bosea sp. (in: a-proteobacteria)]MCO5089570.1 hypothetical protein [Bosea sp. (in: a-proteobacteria)]